MGYSKKHISDLIARTATCLSMNIAVSSQLWASIRAGPFAVHISPDGQSATSRRLWTTSGGKGFIRRLWEVWMMYVSSSPLGLFRLLYSLSSCHDSSVIISLLNQNFSYSIGCRTHIAVLFLLR